METNNLTGAFERDGYVFCPEFADDVLVNEILFNLNRVIRDIVPRMPADHVFYEDQSDKSTLKQLQQLWLHDSFFGKLMNEGSFRQLAETLLGERLVCKNMQYFNKPAGIGQPTPAHQDGFYFKLKPPNALTMWLALDSADEENGCVRYVRGSHLNGMRRHSWTNTLGFSQGIADYPNQEDEANEFALPAQAGDLLAHHALTIHREDGNRSKNQTRRALGFIYYAESAKEDLLARERYQLLLKNKLKELHTDRRSRL